MAYHAHFSLFVHFSRHDGEGIQQQLASPPLLNIQLLWNYLDGRPKHHPFKTIRKNMASIGQAIDAAAFVAKEILHNVTHEFYHCYHSDGAREVPPKFVFLVLKYYLHHAISTDSYVIGFFCGLVTN
jgi:hypothetical protein